MVDGLLAPQFDATASDLLTTTEALLLLIVLTGAVFIGVSTLLAAWTLWYRARKVAAEHAFTSRRQRWQGALQEVLYGEQDPSKLSDVIQPEERVDFLNFLLEYARRLEGEERELIGRLARPHLERVADHRFDRSEGLRARAVQTLGELGLPDYGDAVIAGLDDPSPVVAMVAASTLSRAETAGYAGEILTRLDRFDHWRQDFLAAMLASMGAEAGPTLRWTLSDRESHPKVRAVAADALAESSDAHAADLAHEILTSEPDLELRAACLRLLASVGREEHIEAVRDCVSATEMPIRLTAVRALGHLAAEQDLDTLDRVARDDPSPWVAIAAARALKEAGGTAELEALAGSGHPRSALGLQVISEARSW